jgi:hypothetical protein
VRTLLVAAGLALIAALATVTSSSATINGAPKAGDSITQTDLLGYLFVAPQRGDWLRYRVSIDDNPVLQKTVGFGAEQFGDEERAYFETQTQTSGLIGSPVEGSSVAGGNLVWKMYVDAPDFDDPTRLYSFVAGIIKIGDAIFRLGGGPGQPIPPAYHQSLQALVLYGTLPLPDDRKGVVSESTPQDLDVNGVTVHTVHTTVDFPAHDIGLATGLPKAHVEMWQTTDVPLGVVRIRSTTNGHVYSVELTDYGRGSYRSVIIEKLDDIPYFPG